MIQFGVAELDTGEFAVLGVTPEGDGSVIAGFSDKRFARRAASVLRSARDVPILGASVIESLRQARPVPLEARALLITSDDNAGYCVVYQGEGGTGTVVLLAFASAGEAETAREALAVAQWLRVPSKKP